MTGQRILIAFVDDEANILTSLRRTMLSMLDEWEMAFFATGPDLLARMEDHPFDVVVSDMRMPGMDGATLLDQVAKRHPDTIRVILSGYADNESVFRTVGPAHIYLAKPCNPTALRQAIKGRAALRRLMTGKELRRLLGGLSFLPSAPRLFLDLVAELRSPRASAATVAEIIGRDVAMTAELLKLTNSSFFTVNAVISSPLQAVRILGLEIVQTLVLQLGIFRQFQGAEQMARQIEALNAYSQALGDMAENAALAAGEPDEVAKAARCAGLLSAIGSLVLLGERQADYRVVLEKAQAGRPLQEAETEVFGADHALIGAYLLGLWGFSDSIVEAVTFAAQPSRATGANPILAALHIARTAGPPFPLLASPISQPVDRSFLGLVDRERPQRRWQQAETSIRKEVPR